MDVRVSHIILTVYQNVSKKKTSDKLVMFLTSKGQSGRSSRSQKSDSGVRRRSTYRKASISVCKYRAELCSNSRRDLIFPSASILSRIPKARRAVIPIPEF